MPRIAICLSLLLCCSVELVRAEGPKRSRPSLFINAADVARAKASIAKHSWATEIYKGVREEAKQGNSVAAGVVYQIEGDLKAAEQAKRSLFEAEKNFRTGGPYHWGIGTDEANTYDLIADACTPAQRDQIENYLRRKIKDCIQWKNNTGGTPNMSFTCYWSVGIAAYALGQRGDEEAVRWALYHEGWQGHKIIGGLMPVLEVALRDKKLWHEAPIYGNFTVFGMMMLAVAAKNAADFDLYNTPAKNGATICGCVDGLFTEAFPIEWTGLPGGSIRQITYGHGATTGANCNRASHEDIDPFYVNKPAALPQQHNLYHLFAIAHHLRPDPRYSWLLGQNPRRNEALGWMLSWRMWFPWSLFYTDPEARPAAAPPMPSVIHREMGLAILRADESPTYWTSGKPVLVHQTGEPYGHWNFDHMQIMLFAKGRLMYPSWMGSQYEPVFSAPQRHNRVVVDKKPEEDHGKSHQRYEFLPELKFMTNTCTGLNRGVTEVRSFFVTDQYVADFYDLKGDKEHTYDWFMHGIGSLDLPEGPMYRPTADFATDYPWIEHERRWDTGTTVHADFSQTDAGVMRGVGRFTDEWFNGFAAVRMTLLGEPGTSVYGADDPFCFPENDWGRQRSEKVKAIAAFCARRVAKDTTFAAVHEPYDKSGPVLSARRFGSEPGAAAMLVVGPTLTDVICVATDNGETLHTIQDVRDPAQTVTFRNYAWIRMADGKAQVRGGVGAFALRAGKADGGAVLLNGKPVACAKRGGGFIYPPGLATAVDLSSSAPSNEALVVDAPIFPPLVVKFDEDLIRMATASKFPVKVTVTNPTQGVVGGRLRLTGFSQTRLEPAEIATAALKPGASQTMEATLIGGAANELGEVKAQVVAADVVRDGQRLPVSADVVAKLVVASMQVSVGITRVEDVRHKLPFADPKDRRTSCPVWIVRSPTYEIWFSQRFGLGRSMVDSANQWILSHPWSGGTGLCEFHRALSGPSDNRCIFSGEPGSMPKKMTWRGATTLDCEGAFGDKITAECLTHWVHWRVKAPVEKVPNPGLGGTIAGLFSHPSYTFFRSDDAKSRPAHWPEKIHGMGYAIVKRPGNPSGSVWIMTTDVIPQCDDTERGILVRWDGIMKPEFDVYLGMAPESEVLQRMGDAAAGKPRSGGNRQLTHLGSRRSLPQRSE